MGDVGFSLLLDKPGDVEPLTQFAPGKVESFACPIFPLATATKRKFAFHPGWVRELNRVFESLIRPLLQSLRLLKQLIFSHGDDLLYVAPLLDGHATLLLRGCVKDLLDPVSDMSQVRFGGQL